MRIVHILSSLLLILLVGFEFVALAICRPNKYGLEGKYFTNLEWKGTPTIVSFDNNISTDTLTERREKLPENRYSVEWTGYLDVLETETYTFFLESDDGSWLFLNNQLVVDNGGTHGLVEKEGNIHLRKGVHRIRIRYFQTGGYAILRVFWKKGEAEKRLLNNVYLFPLTRRSRLHAIGKTFLPVFVILSGICMIITGDGVLSRNEHKE